MEEILAGITIFLAVSTPLSAGLQAAAARFHEYALTTPSDADDHVAEVAVRWAEYISQALGFVGRILPVVTSGKRSRK